MNKLVTSYLENEYSCVVVLSNYVKNNFDFEVFINKFRYLICCYVDDVAITDKYVKSLSVFANKEYYLNPLTKFLFFSKKEYLVKGSAYYYFQDDMCLFKYVQLNPPEISSVVSSDYSVSSSSDFVSSSVLLKSFSLNDDSFIVYLRENGFICSDNKVTSFGYSVGFRDSFDSYNNEIVVFEKSSLSNLVKKFDFNIWLQDDRHKMKIKGNLFEIKVGKIIESKGFIVKYNGLDNGVNDNSIDLIAFKRDLILLIQCKDYVYKDIKEFFPLNFKSFVGQCDDYIRVKKLQDFTVHKYWFVSDFLTVSDEALIYARKTKNFFLQEIK